MLDVILTFLQIVKAGLDIAEKIRGKPGGQAAAGPKSVAMFRQTVHNELGDPIAQRLKNDASIQQGLNLMASALADWQVSSTRLCPLLLRKTISFGTEEKNIGFLPAQEDDRFINDAYQEWKAWIEKGPRNNEGLLVYLFDSPHRGTIDAIRALNQLKTGWYHKPRFGCLDVRSGTFYGPPAGLLDQYLQSFGGDTFWNEIMKGVGYLVA